MLKYWLRDLSEPLIPTYLYDDCIAHADDKEKAIAIIDSLPNINRSIVLYMIRFLQVSSRYISSIKKKKLNISSLIGFY